MPPDAMANGTERGPQLRSMRGSVTSMLVAPPAPMASSGKRDRPSSGMRNSAIDSRSMLARKATAPRAGPSSLVRMTPESEYHPSPAASERDVPALM